MTRMLVIPVIVLCGLAKVAIGQQNVQFINIGSEPSGDAGVIITSAAFHGDFLKGTDSRLTKLYYTDQRTLDTIKAYILRSNWAKRNENPNNDKGKFDTSIIVDAYKIIGVDTYPLYVKGKNCLKLFTGTMQYMVNVGLLHTAGYNAMDHLKFRCHDEFWRRNLIREPVSQIDTFRIKDTPRIAAKRQN